MINFNIYLTNIPKQESVVKFMNENKTDSYVFIAPETLEWTGRNIIHFSLSFFFVKGLTKIKCCYIISPAKD